ncbi:MAG: aspartate kinase [Pseudomonadota bacterium]|nr:aspartate kinase [Pseudomonadota bacterium]MEC9458803.1 aspartate kinase [Pseudomonadota bacterium]MED5436665.1 aspartate kinase [Pseudomonadota bacterium]
MSRIVMKFGGTSVGSVDRIKNVSKIVKSEFDKGNQVVVVLSAMAGETDRLIDITKDISKNFNAEEYDVVISSGEQVSVGLLSAALNDIGINSISCLGWQIPIVTSDDHKSARIEGIRSELINNLLNENKVCVVPGFQGINSNGRITTLGRGGSDTSAVAIAAAIDADFCDIYTDVDGVYTSDPNKVPDAKRLDKISYEEMLEMASLGAKVLQTRSVETAMTNNVSLRVLSSFEDSNDSNKGTIVTEEDAINDKRVVTGVTSSLSDAKVTLIGVRDKPGIAAKIFISLSNNNINVDMIVQNISESAKTTDITFTIPKNDLVEAQKIMEDIKEDVPYENIIVDSNIAKISIIGVGMRSNAGVAANMFNVLSENAINIDVISTSEIKISILINDEHAEKAVNMLHKFFGLDN